MRSRRRVLATSLRTTAVLASASCAHPDFPYAAEKPGSAPARPVDVKVPPAWTAFPPAQIAAAHTGWSTDTDAAALLGATARQESCGASDRPSHAHVLGRAAPDQPVDYASLRPLHQQEQPGASTDRLTGLLLAVTSLGSAVAVRSDSVVSQGRATGVHLVVSSAPAGDCPKRPSTRPPIRPTVRMRSTRWRSAARRAVTTRTATRSPR